MLIALAGGFGAYLIIGLLLGVAPTFDRRPRPARVGKLATWLGQVGSPLSPRQFLAASLAIGLIAWIVLGFLMGEAVSSFFPALAVSGALAWSYERRRKERLAAVQESWPDAVRHLLAYVRSGSTVPLAVSALAREGPEVLGTVLKGWDERARLLGFASALETVRQQLADPTSDRVIEVLMIAHDWGGDLVVDVLNDLASEITEDLRTERAIKAEGTTQRIEAWVVGVIPWMLLVYLTTTQGEYRAFYQSGLGRLVVIGAGVWWVVGLAILRRLQRSEAEPRVLGAGAEMAVAP